MSALDAYLARVARGMAGMDRIVREDVLRELRSHLADAVSDGGEGQVVAGLEPPQAIARRYKDLYGYGSAYCALFVAGAALLAAATVAAFLLAEPLASVISFVGFSALVAYLMGVALRAGSGVGLSAGVAAAIVRIVAIAAAQVTNPIAPVTDARGWILALAVSGLLVLLGYLPGRAKETWEKRDATL